MKLKFLSAMALAVAAIAVSDAALAEKNADALPKSSGFQLIDVAPANNANWNNANTIASAQDFVLRANHAVWSRYPTTKVAVTDDNPRPVPEPATYGMMLIGLAVLGALAHRRDEMSVE